ncbi:MAG: hypothetical protein LBT97_12010 [Planctomycetota bacterium]|jgi:hypothetical protein|nr:hypothetical protein [Planctomycetota bacterium]
MAEEMPGVPDAVIAAGDLIKVSKLKDVITRADREAINKAKLKIAFWACRTERLPASRENLTFVLGPDAKDIMESYDRYLAQEDDASPARKSSRGDKKGSGAFWGGV